MKKSAIVALGIGAAVTAGVVKYKQLEKMDMIERCQKGSRYFTRAISRLHEGLPHPPVDCEDEKAVGEELCRRDYVTTISKKNVWRSGYAQRSIVPEDIATKKYCIAGNTRLPANYAKGVLDDVRVRVLTLDDNSGRGTIVLCCVDCIGLSNKNVRKIRNMLADFSKENNISYINISSTHTHSSIDTMGIWGELLTVLSNNKKYITKGEGQLLDSCDNEYMAFLCEKICEAVREATLNMCEGKLYESYMGKSTMQGITEESSLQERGLYGYVWDRREPYDCSTQLLRLRFVPTDKAKKETILLNFSAHPYINSMKERNKGTGDMISGDFVYSLGDYFERNDYNFIFFNGAVAAVYPTRLYSNRLDLQSQARAVGEEIGRIALAMTATKAEIERSPGLNPTSYEVESGVFANGQISQYKRWIEAKGEQVVEEKEIEPLLNLTVDKASLKVDNPIFYMVAKYRIGAYTILSGEGGEYSSFTEVGLLELGDKRRVAFVPGELEPAVLSGSQAVGKDESFSKTEFSSVPLKISAEDEELTVFGLTNDAIGYIIPDNDFSMMFLGTGKVMKKLFGNHYLEIFSFGKNTAVCIADAFRGICERIKGEK